MDCRSGVTSCNGIVCMGADEDNVEVDVDSVSSLADDLSIALC